MAESHVISALVAKKAALSGEVVALQRQIAVLETHLSHIDATIKLFEPDYDLRSIRPKRIIAKQRYFQRGEVMIMVLDVLRTADKALSTREVGEALLNSKGANLNEVDWHVALKPVLSCLKGLQMKGMVRCVGHLPSRGMGTKLWALAGQ